MISDPDPPRPVLGLLVLGSLLLVAEGVLFAAFVVSVVAASAFIVVPALPIALGVLLLGLSWVYSRNPVGALGYLFIVLGALSFLVGGGFVVGGIMIVVAGALAVFAEWVSDSIPRPPPAVPPRARPGPGGTPTPTATPPSPTTLPPPSKGVVIYGPCARCGEIIPRESSRCPSCGSAVP